MGLDSKLPFVGAIEAGGTKFVCAVGRGPRSEMLERVEFPTGSDPQALLTRVCDWLRMQQERHGKLAALGVASFGPVDLDRSSRTYGHITSTPKPGWRDFDLLEPLRAAFPALPLAFDTDVNGAALGERRWGAAQGLDDFVYITVGTGVGGGGMARGSLLHGLVHPEMGHMGLPRLADDEFEGNCPFHGRCWEGLCSGPAIEKRTGMSAPDLPPDHPAWALTIRYMAQALFNITCVLSPRRIVLGGSIRKAGQLGQECFFEALRRDFHDICADYIKSPAMTPEGLREYIVPPALGDDAGICGAIALAQVEID
jgi:fructokinase